MNYLTEKQKQQIVELKRRNHYLDSIIKERIADPIQPIPLLLVLETRRNQVMMNVIKLDSEVAFMRKNRENFSDEMFHGKELRLQRLRGYLEETQNLSDLIEDFSKYGREFTLL